MQPRGRRGLGAPTLPEGPPPDPQPRQWPGLGGHQGAAVVRFHVSLSLRAWGAEGRSLWGSQCGGIRVAGGPREERASSPRPPQEAAPRPGHVLIQSAFLPLPKSLGRGRGKPGPRGWQGAGPPGVLCLGPGSAARSYPVLSLQTSNPIEVTGRASAVHTLLQKAPGVGGLPVHPSLPGSPSRPSPPRGGWWPQQGHPQSRDLTLPSPSLTGVRPLPDCSQGECAAHACTCVPVSLGGRLMAGEDGEGLTDGPRGAQDSRNLGRQQEEAPHEAECVARPVTETWEVVCGARADRLADLPPSAEGQGEPIPRPAGWQVSPCAACVGTGGRAGEESRGWGVAQEAPRRGFGRN